MRVEVFSANSWIYPDSCNGSNRITLNTPKGTYASVQLIIRGVTGEVKCSFKGESDLETELYKLLKVNVNLNSYFFEPLDTEPRTNEELEKYFTRKAPFEVYDPMCPIENGVFSSEGSAALYLCFKIDNDAKSGIRKGDVIFEAAGEKTAVPFEIKVYDLEVPKEKSFNLANWMGIRPSAYGCELLDEKYWDTYFKMARLGLRARQNCIYLTPVFFSCRYENGVYEYDFSNAKKVVDALLNMGYTRIESMHLTSVYSRFIEPHEGVSIHTERGKAALSQFLTQWYAFICENNWNKILIQHIGDEPKDEGVEQYCALSALMKKYMPDIPVVDAILTPKVCDAVDIPVPITRHYQLHKEEYDKAMEGKEVWFYTCCWPVAPFLNRFLDMPLLSVRLLHWLNFKLNINGYLHWGFCSQGAEQDVYTEPSIAFKYMGVPESDQFLPAGDTNIVYPTENGPIGSVRLEMMRAGIEDYELLRLIEKNDRDAANTVVEAAVQGEWQAVVNETDFEELYVKILEAGEKNNV